MVEPREIASRFAALCKSVSAADPRGDMDPALKAIDAAILKATAKSRDRYRGAISIKAVCSHVARELGILAAAVQPDKRYDQHTYDLWIKYMNDFKTLREELRDLPGKDLLLRVRPQK